MSTDRVLEIPPLIKSVFLNKGPQLFELSFSRMFIKIGEVVFGTVCALAMILSIASSHPPSLTVKDVPFPFPGSIDPKKYSPPLISGCAKEKKETVKARINKNCFIIISFYGILLI